MPALAQAAQTATPENTTCYKCGSSCNQDELRIHMLGKCPPQISDLQKKTAKMLKSKGVETATTAAILREAVMQEIKKPNRLQAALDKYQHNGSGTSGDINIRYQQINPYDMYAGPAVAISPRLNESIPTRRKLMEMVLADKQAYNNELVTVINKTNRYIRIILEEV